MNANLLKFAIPLVCVLVSMLLIAACGSGGGKAKIAEQIWDCMEENAENPEMFEQIMLGTLPTASDLEEAKEMYIYVSGAVPIEELEAGRDEACGVN